MTTDVGGNNEKLTKRWLVLGCEAALPAMLGVRIMQPTIKRQGDNIVITVPVDAASLAKATPSQTGKTILVSSTRGAVREGEFSVSLNVTLPNAAYVKTAAKAA